MQTNGKKRHVMVARPIIGAAALLAATMLAGGCIAVGGSDNFTQPTLGRQLQDLKVARDTGAMSQQEYDDAKGRLIRGDFVRK